jgi:hypothetical protein
MPKKRNVIVNRYSASKFVKAIFGSSDFDEKGREDKKWSMLQENSISSQFFL